MSSKEVNGTSIAAQIVEDLFKRLGKTQAYDEASLSRLRQVAAKGNLTVAKSVIEAIATSRE